MVPYHKLCISMDTVHLSAKRSVAGELFGMDINIDHSGLFP